MMVLSEFLSIKDMKQRVMYLLANAYQDLARKLNIQITPKGVQDFFLNIIGDYNNFETLNLYFNNVCVKKMML